MSSWPAPSGRDGLGRATSIQPPVTDSSEVRELARAASDGDERALGRLISIVEADPAVLIGLSPVLQRAAEAAPTVGITGPPGVGKSTLIAELIRELRSKGRRVAVVAVDPSSPFSGGALLGDRIRMQAHLLDRDVFIRSMSNRGHLGGLASQTPDVIDLLSRIGFDIVIVETVGIGQAEVEIASYADTVVLVTTAESGDSVQIAKAGVLEIGDVFVVNKSDRPGSNVIAADLREMLSLGEHRDGFGPPVLELSALTHDGILELVSELTRHREWLSSSGELDQRHSRRAAARLRAVISELALSGVNALEDGAAFLSAAGQVGEGSVEVRVAARALLERASLPPAAAARRPDC
jgi:LAO/AO transport system kinase